MVQPCFAFDVPGDFSSSHFAADKVSCEPGQGVVGRTLVDMVPMNISLEVDSAGNLFGRDDIFNEEIDLPPGITKKAMSCICIPVVFDVDETKSSKQTNEQLFG